MTGFRMSFGGSLKLLLSMVARPTSFVETRYSPKDIPNNVFLFHGLRFAWRYAHIRLIIADPAPTGRGPLTAGARSKLAVILHADVVGSTALVQKDERLAHDRIQDVFRRFSEVITIYGGTTHELRGDALLAAFNRASDAVERCE